ncbi:MAG: MerR family transcriptional regulator [Phycisphaera sp.]|nr:MerR family transcriptional regulator [Phycisphaera sp.]
MKSHYTIGELAKAADVPTTTVRYYERAGLLPPAGRSKANYRLYDNASLERLRFIRAAQMSGFSLDDISVMLELNEQPRGACDSVQELIEHRLAGVRKKLDDLQHVETVLKSALRSCRKGEGQKACAVLSRLRKEIQSARSKRTSSRKGKK